jgi:polyisoprenoid-binding protein YceI
MSRFTLFTHSHLTRTFSFLLAALIVAATQSAQSVCTTKFKPDSLKLTWTGYKFTSKKGVEGTFKSIQFKQSEKALSLKELMESVTFDIDATTLDSGLEQRNKTLLETVIKGLAGGTHITGRIANYDEVKHIAVIKLTMNGVTKDLPFKVESQLDSVTGDGALDMLDFSMKSKYDAVALACKDLHTGPDKVAKTWSEVGVKLSALTTKICP